MRIGFLDLDRIEVLKGPQPNFFGKNAIGGALSLTSRRPTDEFEGTIEVSNEFNYDEVTIFGAVSGPFTESFRARAAIKYRNMNGWIRNVTLNNRQEPSAEDIAMRASAEWDISKDVEIYAKFEYLDSDVDGRQMQLINCGIANPAVASRIDPAIECEFNRRNAGIINPAALAAIPDDAGNSNYLDKTEFYGGSVVINWDLNGSGYILTSQSSWYKTDYNLMQMDFDANPLDVISFVFQDNHELFGQEVRITPRRPAGVACGRLVWYGRSEYTSYSGCLRIGSQRRKDTDFQPSVTLEWRPIDEYMFCAARKEGFKAGGSDLSSITLPPGGTLAFEPEQVTS